MTKRYREPKVKDGQLKIQIGKHEGHLDLCAYWGGALKCDAKYILDSLSDGRFKPGRHDTYPSIMDELASRGYDLSTLRISIEKLPEGEVNEVVIQDQYKKG